MPFANSGMLMLHKKISKKAVNSRDRYKKLIDAVKEKPLWAIQILEIFPKFKPEYETREQNVKKASTDYIRQH